MKKTQILTFSCPDQSGIQAKVTGIMYAHNAFLTDVQSYSDKDSLTFFSRIVFSIDDSEASGVKFIKDFSQLADELNELYAYCEKSVRQYLEVKDVTKLEEVKSIIGSIADSWTKIGD